MIAIIINSLTSGGAERVVLTLLETYQRLGIDVRLICIEKESYYHPPAGIQVSYLTEYQSLEHHPFRLWYVFASAWKLKKMIKKEGIKIVQSHLIRASMINVLAGIFGSRHFSQIVNHCATNVDRKGKLYRSLYTRFNQWIYQRSDSVVSICELMRQHLQGYFHLSDDLAHEVIYNPHDLDHIRTKSQEPSTAFQFSPDKKYIIWLGRIVRIKRLNDLLRAFSELSASIPNCEVIILGEGELKTPMEMLAKKLEIDHKVHFLGHQDNPFTYIRQSDVMVLSSEREGLPNILIESMICGTPVVSADCVSGPREILHPASDINFQVQDEIELAEYGILYPVGKVSLLVKALRLLLNNSDLYHRYQTAGQQRMMDFEAGRIVEKHLQTFPAKWRPVIEKTSPEKEAVKKSN